MKVLITGANGQLGYDVSRRLAFLGIANQGIDIQDCDLTDRDKTVATIHAFQPDCVVHCAAYTAVDKAESDPERCRLINVEGTRNVAIACQAADAKMIYISTDYVFGGGGNLPHMVSDTKHPINVYGQTKYEGELAVQEILDRHFIVRTSWVYGQNGSNFVSTMLRLGKEKKQISVVSDQIGSPTYTIDLSVLLCDMLQTDRFGVYHATNEGFCSWYTFAANIMAHAGLPCQVLPVASAAYPTAARRPLNSRLSKQSLYDAGFTPLPLWDDALQRFLAALPQSPN